MFTNKHSYFCTDKVYGNIKIANRKAHLKDNDVDSLCEDRAGIVGNVCFVIDGHSGVYTALFYEAYIKSFLESEPMISLTSLIDKLDKLIETKYPTSCGASLVLVRTVYNDETGQSGHFEILFCGDSKAVIFSKYNGETNIVYETEKQDTSNPEVQRFLEEKNVELVDAKDKTFKFLSPSEIENFIKTNKIYQYPDVKKEVDDTLESPLILYNPNLYCKKMKGGLKKLCKGHTDGKYSPHIRTHKYIEIPFRKRDGEDIYIHMGSSGTYEVIYPEEIALKINESNLGLISSDVGSSEEIIRRCRCQTFNHRLFEEIIRRNTKPMKYLFYYCGKWIQAEQPINGLVDMTSLFAKI